MNKSTPWDSIPIPKTDFNVVRISETAGISIYWGRDAATQCLLILELEGEFTTQFRQDSILLNGINVDLRSSDVVGQQRLILTLARHIDRDLFFSLCNTLILNIKDVKNPAVVFSVSLTHLKRWKVFLGGKNSHLLSAQEICGLFGELHVLRMLYQNTLSQLEAVDAWCGPDGSHQDFIFGNRAIEVKSLSGKERNTVRISSEDQLESLVDELFLLTQRLSNIPNAQNALSLNEIVALIESELTDFEAIEQFRKKLINMSYVPLAEYDTSSFIVSWLQGYRVTDAFPRLVRSELPQGITKLSYDIMLEAITLFSCDQTDIFVDFNLNENNR